MRHVTVGTVRERERERESYTLEKESEALFGNFVKVKDNFRNKKGYKYTGILYLCDLEYKKII